MYTKIKTTKKIEMTNNYAHFSLFLRRDEVCDVQFAPS